VPKTFASTRRREHEVWPQMGGKVTQLSWRKCQKVVLVNGSAQSEASLALARWPYRWQAAWAWSACHQPVCGVAWVVTGPVARARDGVGSSPLLMPSFSGEGGGR
jgi:hypothetical protein